MLASVHDLRSPLSAMSGWLEVLERQNGSLDPVSQKAFDGLRRAIDRQQQCIAQIAEDVALARSRFDGHGAQPLPMLLRNHAQSLAAEFPALEALATLQDDPHIVCPDPAGPLDDAVAALLRVIGGAHDPARSSLVVDALHEALIIDVHAPPRFSGALRSLFGGDFLHRSAAPGRYPPSMLWASRCLFARLGIRLDCLDLGQDRLRLVLSGVDASRGDTESAPSSRLADAHRPGGSRGLQARRSSRAQMTPRGARQRPIQPAGQAGTGSTACDCAAGSPVSHLAALPDLDDKVTDQTNWPRSVLVVDDQPEIRDMLKVWLASHDVDVTIAESAVQARALLEHRPDIDLCLIDIWMPGEDGISLVRTLREQEDAVVDGTTAADDPDRRPLIAVSADSSPEARLRAREAGFTDFMAKPLVLRSLLDQLRRYGPTQRQNRRR